MPGIRVLVLGCTLAFALHTSAASKGTYELCGGLVAIALILAMVVQAS